MWRGIPRISSTAFPNVQSGTTLDQEWISPFRGSKSKIAGAKGRESGGCRQCWDSVSGSLDPFKPFHRRFVRLHNAATLIKINYTLASVRSFIRHIPTILARRRFFILAPSLFLHRTFDHQPPGSERHRLGNHPLPPFPLFSFFIPPLAPPSLVYLHFIRDLIYRPPSDRLVGVRSTLWWD